MSKFEKRITVFSSAGEYVSHVKDLRPHPSWDIDPARDSGREAWAGGSFQDAVKYASEGWSEGLNKVTKKLDVMKQAGRGKARIYDVAGDYPSVPRALSGAPDSMTRRHFSDSSRKPILDIFISPVFSSATNAEAFINVGAAMASFIDSCEAVGYSVNLMTGMIAKACYQDKINVGAVFPLKLSGQVLDLDRLIYFIAHPSFLRRLGFAHMSHLFDYAETGSGMGQPPSYDLIKEYAEKDSIILQPNSWEINACNTPAKAVTWLETEIKKQRPDIIEAITAAREAA